MKLKKIIYLLSLCLVALSACSDEESLELKSEDKTIQIKLGEEYTISPQVSIEEASYKWVMDGEVISDQSFYIFNGTKIGKFNIHFEAYNDGGKFEQEYELVVYKIRESGKESSPYLSEIIEFKPAPGQFTNEDGYMDATKILGKPEYNMISLGGFGGYVTAAFDHTVVNRTGKEIMVYGNPFENWSEPGIVMVSFDYNGNGKADDEWYELAGSDYSAEGTIHNYEITYTNPKKEYTEVEWTDNQGNSGVIKTNQWHTGHNYYPEFIDEQESVTFTGTLLSNNVTEDPTNPNWDGSPRIGVPEREWGYADNYSREYQNLKVNTFDIEWAVNAKGEKVELPGVDFIKVYTAMNADAKICGEVSTEVMGAADMLLLE